MQCHVAFAFYFWASNGQFHTVEEKPVEVNPVKTEIKKEATNILVTKAEKMPHQPTTGISSHSII